MDSPHKHSVDYELLGRFFAGECTPEEAARTQSWIEASADNRASYEALRSIWEQAENPSESESVNTDAAWARLSRRLGMDEAAQEAETPGLGRKSFPSWWRIAAILVMAIGLSWVTVRFLNKEDVLPNAQMLTLEAGDAFRTDTLPDCSVVTLNAHAKLRYPETFAEAKREVELEGEAFFEVERNPTKPFLIHAGSADVRVLGTSFNVRSSDSQVEVVVATGKVELSAPQDDRAKATILVAGQRGDYSPTKGEIASRDNDDENFLYWKNRRLVFRNTPLTEVAAELQTLFPETSIELEGEEIGNCPLTTTFENLSVESILKIIAETFNLEMTQDENTFTLSGEGC
jgi:ferric-dicitrate binding protein FerR (iron transport regulator)